MNEITIKAYAKINLSLDVVGLRQDGFHLVEMIMQQIELHDEVLVRYRENNSGKIRINLSTSKSYLPNDNNNIAYKAAELMAEIYGKEAMPRGGDIRIDIRKEIFVAAGLAGGSSNAAAVILALNKMWDLSLDLEKMCAIGAKLGSDIPFCIMGQAKKNEVLGEDVNNHRLACTCALAIGTGTTLIPIEKPLDAIILLSKPNLSVSTKEVYCNIDEIMEQKKCFARPDSKKLAGALEIQNKEEIYKHMENVLELYTLDRYKIVGRTKNKMNGLLGTKKVMMSGSGPTIFSLYEKAEHAKNGFKIMKKINKETCITHTLL